MATTVYKKTGRTGGTANDLDGIDGNSLVNGDFAFVVESDRIYFYVANLTGGLAANNPLIIVPVANPGTINWELKAFTGKEQAIFNEKTIAAGAVTLVGAGNYDIDTEGNAASDDLESVAGLNEGECAILRPESDARTVVVKNNTVIKLAGIDCTLDSQYDAIMVQAWGAE